jgi:glucose-6-phosphate-specific signal transduction histidine kinase
MLLFLIGCIGSRAAFAYAAKVVSPTTLQFLGGLALIPVIGWFYIIFIGKRTTGPEVLGDRIWWQNLRIIHMSLYLLFAIMALMKLDYAWKILAADVLLGLSFFLAHHFGGWNP